MIAQVDKTYLRKNPSAAIRRIIARLFFEGRPITTKHRWINTIVFAHLALEKRLPAMKKVQKPIFIVGTGRSGTTILGALMSMHPDVGFLSEPKAIWHSIYPYEDVSGNYTMSDAKYVLDELNVDDTIKDHAHKIFGAYLTATFSGRVVDKNPELVFRVPFVKEIFPDAKFVFLVRNGFDTINSISNWSEREGVTVNGKRENWWGVNNKKWELMLDELVVADPDLGPHIDEIRQFKSHYDMATVEWIVTMRKGLSTLESHADCMKVYRYEDLLESPRAFFENLLGFCELQVDQTLLQYAENRLTAAPDYDVTLINPILQVPFRQMMTSLNYSIV